MIALWTTSFHWGNLVAISFIKDSTAEQNLKAKLITNYQWLHGNKPIIIAKKSVYKPNQIGYYNSIIMGLYGCLNYSYKANWNTTKLVFKPNQNKLISVYSNPSTTGIYGIQKDLKVSGNFIEISKQPCASHFLKAKQQAIWLV